MIEAFWVKKDSVFTFLTGGLIELIFSRYRISKKKQSSGYFDYLNELFSNKITKIASTKPTCKCHKIKRTEWSVS